MRQPAVAIIVRSERNDKPPPILYDRDNDDQEFGCLKPLCLSIRSRMQVLIFYHVEFSFDRNSSTTLGLEVL